MYINQSDMVNADIQRSTGEVYLEGTTSETTPLALRTFDNPSPTWQVPIAIE